MEKPKALVNQLPEDLKNLSVALSGTIELTADIWTNASKTFRTTQRHEVYDIINKIEFIDSFLVPSSLFQPPPHKRYWDVDVRQRVVRVPKCAVSDDVYLPHANLTDVLEINTESIHKYGQLRKEIQAAAKRLDPTARIAETFYNLSVYQANQIKFPLERFLLCLVVSYAHELSPSPLLIDEQNVNFLTIEANPALSALKTIMLHFMEYGKYKPPFLKTSRDIVFALYDDKRPLSSQIAPLMIDLVNYAIVIYSCNISRLISVPTVRMMLKAAGTTSYNHTQLKLKKIIPAASLLSVYHGETVGRVPIVVWEEPREEYRFRLDGARDLPRGWKNELQGAKKAIEDASDLASSYGMTAEFEELRSQYSKISVHNGVGMKMIRDALAGVSSVFITRTPTDTVLQEYVHAPVIERPIPPQDWTDPVGVVKYLKNDTQHYVARNLYATWREAAVQVANNPDNWDPNTQAILRSQYVTPRGGSGSSVKKVLTDKGVILKNFSKSGAKSSTKIVQAAQLASIPFTQYQDTIMAPVSHGVRIQVQRRSRTIMPFSVPQQQVSAPHTLCGNYINKFLNKSTTSGSNVTEKVIPLGIFASSPPTRAVNIDIKACDSSITWGFFLSVICGAMHEGMDGINVGTPFLGVPATLVEDGLDLGIVGTRSISGMQNMVQKLSQLYERGFEYEVKDAFSPGNAFTHHTTTFPSGSTATSTEHTANNSTMMKTFLMHWLPNHTKDLELIDFVKKLDVNRNYVCQGDDGIMILPTNDGRPISSHHVESMLELLSVFGKESGWVFDIEFNGSAEYLKLLFLNGCRIPNVGRHPVVGKERASRDQDVIWPGGIDAFIGMYNNGVEDQFHWRRWLKFSWSMACFLSSKAVFIKGKSDVIQYPSWSFVYLGLPPIRIFDSPPWIFSPYTPGGDLGMYSIMVTGKKYIVDRMQSSGYQKDNTDLSNESTFFRGYDYVKFMNDCGVLPGYYMSQIPRSPDKTKRKVIGPESRDLIDSLRNYLFSDQKLTIRVNYGHRIVTDYPGRLPRKLPSLDDVPQRWFDTAVEADMASTYEIEAMDVHLLRGQFSRYQSFSKVLEAYLSVDWELTDLNIPAGLSLDVPLVAGCDPTNGEPYYKMMGLGPMMESIQTYFHGTVFMSRAVSGLDVESIDVALLKMKALKVPTEVITGFLMTCGLSKPKASTVATKINFQDMKTVQVAKLTGLNVSDKWMSMNFDRLLHSYVDVKTYVSDSSNQIRLPGGAGWLRGVIRFLGAGVVMTRVGPPQPVRISVIYGGGARLHSKFLNWMVSDF
uniref:RNA-directed RNA polymerase n=1 Tax=Piscine orthoreovirus TaxID=1157337 RepID=A0A7T0ME75_9REOV|nr:lambda3 [Piscine orthoreovirus]